MNSRLKWLSNCVNIVFYFLITVVLASCSSTGSRYPASIDKGIPSSHVWQYLHFYGGEELGYATYSYVLVGRDHSNQKSTSLYYDLIKAIQASTVNAESLKDIVSMSSLNLFIIPKSGDEPDYELSKSLLASLSTTSPLNFSRPGPYIITLYQPISIDNGDKIADILYIDLTDVHRKAIPEIVRTYREQVIDEELDGIEKLKSLRLSLLNIALHTEDSIGFAKSAYAGMRSAFSE
ncbi:hypothetical protein [Pseudoalteromonas fuliginea]|uniref:hypothetical protein n=1 Tax=Pseudoalteromonas fuliginea TaxID=1872678 RepID=UPI00319E00FD